MPRFLKTHIKEGVYTIEKITTASLDGARVEFEYTLRVGVFEDSGFIRRCCRAKLAPYWFS